MSCLSVFQLEKEPFSTSPDPEFFYRSNEHYAALNRLEIAIRLKRGLSVILGDVGTGKTTLSRALLQSFYGEEENYIFHMVLSPSFKSEYQFLTHLTKTFGISPFFRSTIDHREAIEKYLFRKCVQEKKTVVLLIDEGQKLMQPHLEVLRTLLNYETNQYKMLQLVILGQMELLPRIKRIKNFMDRISMRYILNPLDEYETGQLIEFRLKQAGYKEEKSIFSYEAIRKIYEYTQGYPRQISLICHNAMEHLIMNDGESVTAEVIESIISKEKVWE
ncbi:MAG: AAA family ATPase [Candidatus Omnitrophica bacterium]|nr:AAA family ATPase [Candidatus Omnitrophota bacterium]MBU1996273.1 AAA family ATPase [Candidatus Omnitrophota bacterium]MBU4333069.1 AAA family ATPase [Candidatus Omnitrophota bacterium]